jgi:uncharacterized protein YqgC (DUF456 family)
MTTQCCEAGQARGSLARRFSKVAVSLLPAAVLALLPKCPLCLAAWLTFATGFSFSASGILWMRAGIVLVCAGAVASIVSTRAFGGLPSYYGGGKKGAR